MSNYDPGATPLPSPDHRSATVVKSFWWEAQIDGSCFGNPSFVFHAILMQSPDPRLSLMNLGIWNTPNDYFNNISLIVLEFFTWFPYLHPLSPHLSSTYTDLDLGGHFWN